MKTAEELAAWLESVKYEYIAADYCECCGASIELDAEGLARAILDYVQTTENKS